MPHVRIEESAVSRFEVFHLDMDLAAHVDCPYLFADLANDQSCHQEYCLRHPPYTLQSLQQLQQQQ